MRSLQFSDSALHGANTCNAQEQLDLQLLSESEARLSNGDPILHLHWPPHPPDHPTLCTTLTPSRSMFLCISSLYLIYSTCFDSIPKPRIQVEKHHGTADPGFDMSVDITCSNNKLDLGHRINPITYLARHNILSWQWPQPSTAHPNSQTDPSTSPIPVPYQKRGPGRPLQPSQIQQISISPTPHTVLPHRVSGPCANHSAASGTFGTALIPAHARAE